MLTERIPRYSPADEVRERVRALDVLVQARRRGLVLDVDADRDLAAGRPPGGARAPPGPGGTGRACSRPGSGRRGAASPGAAGPRRPAAFQPRCCSGLDDQARTWRPWDACWRSSTSVATSQPLASSWSTTARAISLEPLAALVGRRLPGVRVLGIGLVVQVRTAAASPGSRCPCVITLPSTVTGPETSISAWSPIGSTAIHAVDRLAGLRLPHLGGERRVVREPGRHGEVAPLLARVGPAPPRREVTGDRHRAGAGR